MKSKTIYNAKGGYRFENSGLPEVGTKFQNISGEIFTYDGEGPAGMLLLTDGDGIQSAFSPVEMEHYEFVELKA